MTVLEIPTPDPRTFDEASRPFAEAVSARYAVKRLIGRGGMGVVYLARDRRLDRLVAIKTLPPHLAADETVKQRFLREIRMAGAMSHPNIVPIHGADEIDGHVFFVMGFVDGDSLAATIQAMGRMEPVEAARVLRDVTSALVHAHGRGTIHRDIKAENILLERGTGRALVTDFGIARLAEAAPLTATGQMLGTVYYISPEQVAGERIDHRSDLYSLGVVGFFALTGTFPFDSELASAVLVAHVNKPAPPVRSVIPAVPPALAAIVDRCLAKDPARRYDTAEQLLLALEAFLAGGGRAPIERPKLISDTEAQAVWQRAAALQASTGIQPRPEAIPQSRNDAADAARTSGHNLDNVRDAAREAGISTRYIDHALVERGLAKPTSARPAPARSSWWAGAPLEISSHSEAEGEIDPSRFDGLFNLVRDGTGEVGSVTAGRRELGWRAEWFGSRLDVSVVPADGVTSVRVVQRIRAFALATMSASVAIGISIGPVAALISRQIIHSPTPRWARELGITTFVSRGFLDVMAVGIGVAVVLSAVPIARALIRRFRRQQAQRVHLLGEAVTANVRLAIAEDQRS
ncbi:MAG TPA: serine/threonine-protein kinase [Gemmatimonadaceae bacterium]|nr:serine/threonine-protein kinase [Gemmatimonadaceae bacterium]